MKIRPKPCVICPLTKSSKWGPPCLNLHKLPKVMHEAITWTLNNAQMSP